MVFARLTPADKDAFFALLDEYFASRPDLFGSSVNGAAGKAAAVSAVSQAISSAPAIPATNGWKRPDAAATAEISNSVGRVAAAAAAFRSNANAGSGYGNGEQQPPTPAQNSFPRPPARRAPSSSSDDQSSSVPAGLTTTKKFGDVDVSSTKNMFTSLRGANKNAQVAPPTPPAFSRRTDFAPPPRRVPSTGSGSNSRVSPAASVTSLVSSPPPPAPPRRPTQAEPEGEWAEALYEYSSEDPGDLPLQEGDRVFIVERTSDDWWTGELDGRRGLVPAAYIKVL